jgi:hypothetical protein
LVVGRIVDRGGYRVVGLRSVARGVADVSDLAWESATSLVVLGRLSGVAAPVRVAVDGSTVALVNRYGLEESTPVSVAAAPDRPLTVGARYGGAAVLFRLGGIFTKERGIVGGQPFYPG